MAEMRNHKVRKVRKPMPPPTKIQEAARQRIIDSFTPDQIEEGVDDYYWHPDPADNGWDWGPPDKSGNLWEIK